MKPHERWAEPTEQPGWENLNLSVHKALPDAGTNGNLASNNPPCWGLYSVLPFIAMNTELCDRKWALGFHSTFFLSGLGGDHRGSMWPPSTLIPQSINQDKTWKGLCHAYPRFSYRTRLSNLEKGLSAWKVMNEEHYSTAALSTPLPTRARRHRQFLRFQRCSIPEEEWVNCGWTE